MAEELKEEAQAVESKPAEKSKSTKSALRDRIKEFKRVPAAELMTNEGNWRTHPNFQRDALKGILGKVGIADALIAYESERQGGLTLIDGHLRKDDYPGVEWPTLILDVDDDEADMLMSVFDPLAALAGMDKERTLELTSGVITDDLALRELVTQLQAAALAMEDEEVEPGEEREPGEGPPEMDLHPFEHYDYLVLFFQTSLDYERALDLLDVKKEGFTIRTGKNWEVPSKRKIGMGRCLNGVLAIKRLRRKVGG